VFAHPSGFEISKLSLNIQGEDIFLARCLKLGALKQSLNGILSISKACGKFLLAIGVPLPMFFSKTGMAGTPIVFK